MDWDPCALVTERCEGSCGLEIPLTLLEPFVTFRGVEMVEKLLCLSCALDGYEAKEIATLVSSDSFVGLLERTRDFDGDLPTDQLEQLRTMLQGELV